MDEAGAQRGWRGATLGYTVELLGLSVWVGGLIAILATVIPEVFNIGVESGGRLLTRVFGRYNTLVFGAMGLLLGVSLYRLWLSLVKGVAAAGLPPVEWVILGLMTVIQLLLVLVLVPDSVTLQEQAFTTQGEAARKAAHEAFFHSHKIVRYLYLANLGLGIGLMSVKVRGWVYPRSASI